MNSNKLIAWGIFLVLTLVWGSSFILMKYSQRELTAWQVAALRIFSAAVVFLPFAVYHLFKLPRKKIPWVILSGITGNLLPAFLYAIAISRIDSSLASILNAFTPMFVVVIAIIFFGDKIKIQKIIGVVIGVIGLFVLFKTSTGISLHNLGFASLILIATISYGLNVNLVSHFLKDINPMQVASVSISFMIFPTIYVLWQQRFFDLPFDDGEIQLAVLESVLLGVVATAIATALFYVMIKKAGGLFASLVTYSIPVVAMLWGIADQEQVGWLQFVSLGIILAGVYLANK
jgi:drug/metabolite transporter (DMT)-like permease